MMDILHSLLTALPIGHELGPFMVVGILVLAGLVGGWVGKWIKLPHVTGNILGGIIVGPACLGLIGTHEQLEALQPLSTFAMSLIAVSVGGHLSYRRIHNSLRRIFSTALAESFMAFSMTILICKLFGMNWPTILLLGAISVSSAPATTIALVREVRAKGPFVKTLISSIAINNILCILLFVIMHTFVQAFFESGETTEQVGKALLLASYHLVGSLALGFGAGWISKKLVARPKFHDFSTILLIIMLCDGIAAWAGLSPLLVCLFFGVYLSNSSEVAERQLTTLVPLEPILYVCFFTLSGVSLHLGSMLQVGSLMVVYFFARILGKSLGSALGGLLGRCNPRIWKNMIFALYPQAGIAIGLAVVLSSDVAIPEDIRYAVSAIILAGVTLSEIIGPLCTKAALVRSGEAGRDRQRLVEFLSEEFILMDLKALDKWDAIRRMTDFLVRTHRVEHMDANELYETIVQREKQVSTAIGHGVAIPHGHIEKGPAIQGVLAICPEGLDFDAPDGQPTQLLMLIVTPKEHKQMHLKVLASLSAMVRDERIRTRLISAMSPEDAMDVFESEEVRDYNYFLEGEKSEA